MWRGPKRGVVFVSGYDEAVAVYRDHERFSSCNTVAGPFFPWPVPLEGDDISAIIAEHRDALPFSDQLPSFDPPEHTDQRGLLMRLITPKRLKENEEFMWRLADQTFAEFLDRGECEFVHDYALPFTLLVVADLLGVPEDDRDAIRANLLHKEPKSTQKMEHKPLEFLYEQFTAYIEDRRREPRDDVMTGLASATFPDGTLPPVHDVMRIASNLFSAGGETTARLMSTSFRILGDRPDLQAALRADPDTIPAFMEEALRLEPPIKGEFRLSKVPVTVGEMELAPGTSVFVLNGAANRDPRQFDDPLEFRLDRVNGRQHIGFGHGIHSCAGAPLARGGDPHHHRAVPRAHRRHPDLRIAPRSGRTRVATSTTPRTCCEVCASCTSSSLRRRARDGDLQPHRAGRDRPRAVEALLPGGVRVPVLVRDPAARRSHVEAQLPRTAARRHRVVPHPRRLRARAHPLRGRGRGQRRTSRATMADPGITHVSISVDDVRAAAAKVVEHGGEIIEESDVGLALFVRDPDGQLLELLPADYRDRLPPKP